MYTMIRNIIFDMGNVLLRYSPEKICQNTVSPEFRLLVSTYLLNGPEWKLMDKGVLSEEDALKRIFAKVHAISSSQEYYEKACQEITHCLKNWYHYMDPIYEMGDLVRRLKKYGYHIYLCSNAALSFYSYYRKIPGLEYFDGLLVSADEKCLKPDAVIYERLFEKFHLNPLECFFIDDLPQNIEGAKRCQMDGYCFADGDIEKLKDYLHDLLQKGL